MAGPWEKYAAQAATSAPAEGPWTKYAAELPVPPAPPGAVIHDTTASYAANDPSIRVDRPSNDGTAEGVPLAALAARANSPNAGYAAQTILPTVQGSTLNFGDEAISALYGAGQALRGNSPTDAYAIAQEMQRQDKQQVTAAHPALSMAGELAGGLGTGVGLAKAGVSSGAALAKAGLESSLPWRMLGGAAEGAGYGAAAGFGGGDAGPASRVEQAVSNIPLGAVVGTAAPAVADAVSGGWSFLRNLHTAMRDPERRANELLVRRIMQDQQTPETLAQSVEAAAGDGQSAYRAVDAAGKNTQRLAAMAAKAPGKFRETSAEILAGRQMDQGQRVAGHLNDALGAGDAYATEQALIASRRANAQPLYEAAYAAPPPEGAFYDELLKKPIVQKAFAAMQTAAANSVDGMKGGVNMTDMVAGGAPGTVGDGPRGLSTRGWDYVKRYLDTTVDSLYNGSSEDKALAPVYKDLRDALKAQLAADNPDYARALSNYADHASALDSIQAGRDLATARNPDEARAAYGALSGTQQDLAKKGFVREIQAKLEKQHVGADKTRAFANDTMATNLDNLITDPQTRALFDARMAREGDMLRASRQMIGGSSTYENLMDGGDISNVGGALAALMSGHPLRAGGLLGGQLLGHATRAANGLNEPTAQVIGDYLMQADPAKIRSLADMFAAQTAQTAAPPVGSSAFNAGFNAMRSGETGKRRRP